MSSVNLEIFIKHLKEHKHMKLWLFLGILSYLSYAISTSIDKYMMNHKYDILRTNTFKMFFDGVILLIIGLIFFDLSINRILILGALILGFLYATGGVVYYKALKFRNVGEVIPASQSSQLLLIFLASIIVFNEPATTINYIGIILILVGAYSVLSKNVLKLPRLDKSLLLISLMIIINVIYALLAKKILLINTHPLSLAIMMYFSTTLVMFIYDLVLKRKSLSSIINIKPDILKIGVASLFGALGTFLLFSALSIGDASKVYPIAGLQSVFIFIIASAFLKEKFRWHRMIGTIIVFAGIFLISL